MQADWREGAGGAHYGKLGPWVFVVLPEYRADYWWSCRYGDEPFTRLSAYADTLDAAKAAAVNAARAIAKQEAEATGLTVVEEYDLPLPITFNLPEHEESK